MSDEENKFPVKIPSDAYLHWEWMFGPSLPLGSDNIPKRFYKFEISYIDGDQHVVGEYDVQTKEMKILRKTPLKDMKA